MKKEKPLALKGDQIDPPNGWKYDFPKVVERDLMKDELSDWLIVNGYVNEEEFTDDQIFRFTRIIEMNKVYHILKDKKYKSKRAIDFFRGEFFWDCRKEKILLGSDYDLVIERVLSRSARIERDLPILNQIYGEEIIKEIIKERGHLIIGNEQIEYIAKEYNLNPKSFGRYF